MKHVLTLFLLIVVVLGLLSPKYGFYQHAIADEIANHAGSIRGENPLTNVAVKVIEVTNRSPYLLPSQVVQSTDPNRQIGKRNYKWKNNGRRKFSRHLRLDDTQYHL